MTTLQLTYEEHEVLLEILKHAVEELSLETFRTDTSDFKQKLKHRQAVIECLLEKLEEEPAPVI